MKKIKKQMLFAVIITAMIFGFVSPVLASTRAEIENHPQLKQVVEELKAAKKVVHEKNIEKAKTQSMINQLDDTISNLDAQMSSTVARIALIQQQIEQQEALLKERMRVMYMLGENGLIEMLFSAENFTDLLTRIDLVKNVAQDNEKVINNLKKEEKAEQGKIQDSIKAKKQAETERAKQQQVLVKQQAIVVQQEAVYTAQLEAGEKIANKFGLSLKGYNFGGDYIWPIDLANGKAFYITSIFGYRSSASTYGVGTTNHGGIDVTPGSGEPVLAIADGVVKSAGTLGGYGNCVELSHGKNDSGVEIGSFYAHMSSTNVLTGQRVKQGDVVGFVGSTGASTGPHLHFEMYENGNKVDPLSYYDNYKNRFVFTE